MKSKSHTITSGLIRKLRRTVKLTVGKDYCVKPINPLKKKHRDRVCTILEFDDEFVPLNVKVKFLDNGRIGKVCCSDLVPVEQVIESKPGYRKR